MIRLGPIPLTLFSLVPLNDRARDVIAHPNNHLLFPHPLKVTRLSILVFIFAQLRKTHLLHSDDVTAISHCKELAFLGSNALLKSTQVPVL